MKKKTYKLEEYILVHGIYVPNIFYFRIVLKNTEAYEIFFPYQIHFCNKCNVKHHYFYEFYIGRN